MSPSKQLTVEQALSMAERAMQQGNTALGQRLYKAVLEHQPSHQIAKKGLRELQKGLSHSQSVEAQIANPSQDQLNKLINLYNSGQKGKVEEVCSELLKTYPQSVILINVLGAALQGQGKLEDAVQAYSRVIELKPDYAEAYYNRGNALEELGRLAEALENYDKAIELKPKLVEAYSNRGNVLQKLGQLAEAVKSCNKAIGIRPNLAEAYNNRGIALQKLGQLKKGIESYDRVIELKPDYAEAYYNRGNALQELGQLAEAVKSYDKAIGIRPNLAEAYSNRGKALLGLGQLDDAVESYEKAIELKPDYAAFYSSLLFALNYSTSHSPDHYSALARRFNETFAKKVRSRFSGYRCLPRPERLSVGIVSGDLRNHPVGYFLESVLSCIDPAVMELIAYPTNPKTDDLSERIKPFFSAWKPIYGLSDEAAANQIYADGIHVLLDLSGHTAHNRLPVFCWKPSPVQASWLGYCATTGLSEMDYLLGDPYVTPPEDDGNFAEKVWRLPDLYVCFTPPDVNVAITEPPALKRGYVTFGSFNNLTKVNNKVLALWAKTLQAIPNSRLLLKAKQLDDVFVREIVIQQFAAHKIHAHRIIFRGKVAREKHFKAYNEVDIALDPFPYSGVTTSFEGLWMGVPVLTLAGDRFVSRQGVGILMNAGLPDWIAANEDEYLAKAIAFASDLDKLAVLRAGLRAQVLASRLFDARRFAGNFQDALREMWRCREEK